MFCSVRNRESAPGHLQHFGVFLHLDAVGPSGTGAPVKIRAQVPGCSGCGAWPAKMRWLTGSGSPCQSARRKA
jgi:hypothetical protein